jgi:outer membrane protein assembly factor BamE (lipoprotein component of BamABCDE complex)
MKIGRSSFLLSLALLWPATGCVTGASHAAHLQSAREREMTLGIVQKEIRAGMSQADVAASLGSPNIVTRDKQGKETWIYDKIATEASYSSDSGGLAGGAAGGGIPTDTPALILGGVGGTYQRSAGASSVTQKTLTVVIKFNDSSLVESYSYNMSKF